MKASFGEKFKSFLAVNRFEFTPVSQGIILSFMVLNINSFRELLTWPVLLAFLSYNIATYWGGAINVYFDYYFDAKSPIKKRLPRAIDIIGKANVRKMLIIECIVFLVIGFVLSFYTKRPILFILLAVGTFFTIAYSVEPLRFKRRGFLNSVSLFLIIMFLPPLFGWLTVNTYISFEVLIMILGLALVQYGNGLYYTTVDYSEDMADGIITPSVKLGVVKSVKISLLLVFIGGVCLAYGYYNLEYINMLGLIIISCGQAVPFFGILQLLDRSKFSDSKMEVLMKKHENRIPVWIAVASFSVLIANVFYMLHLNI